MTRADCNNIVFSSSATVYGEPQYLPYDELHPTKPVNPYGRTKLIIEEAIRDWVYVNKKRSGIILRYFNLVGAHKSGKIGEAPNGTPNNLMPDIAKVAVGEHDFLNIFGNDYETIDGTGARDYVHVVDLASAHVSALINSVKLSNFEIMNIGTGQATTVLELLKRFEHASGVIIKSKYLSRRDGNLAVVYANSARAMKLLKWSPKTSIDQMCKDTWRWQKNHINDYKIC